MASWALTRRLSERAASAAWRRAHPPDPRLDTVPQGSAAAARAERIQDLWPTRGVARTPSRRGRPWLRVGRMQSYLLAHATDVGARVRLRSRRAGRPRRRGADGTDEDRGVVEANGRAHLLQITWRRERSATRDVATPSLPKAARDTSGGQTMFARRTAQATQPATQATTRHHPRSRWRRSAMALAPRPSPPSPLPPRLAGAGRRPSTRLFGEPPCGSEGPSVTALDGVCRGLHHPFVSFSWRLAKSSARLLTAGTLRPAVAGLLTTSVAPRPPRVAGAHADSSPAEPAQPSGDESNAVLQ